MVANQTPKGGLWAWTKETFYGLAIEPGDRDTNHVSWFQELGLPDYGAEYDRILRGRLTWDWHFDHFVLSYYGVNSIPNAVYDAVVDYFGARGYQVVEKPSPQYWA